MPNIIQTGSVFRPYDSDDVKVHKTLPSGFFRIVSTVAGNVIEKTAEPSKQPKLYGNHQQIIERMATTFLDRPDATGILLSGPAGCGKTLMARELCLLLNEKHGIPTIMVNDAKSGDDFSQTITGIDGACVVIFDEFEKNFNDEQQTKLLTLLDGMYKTKKLFIFTVNEAHKVNKFMFNRPGRIYYNLKFTGLDEKFITDYLNDHLNNKSLVKPLTNIHSAFETVSFDMLQAIVEEVNRYGSTVSNPLDLLDMLNINESDSSKQAMQFIGLKLPNGLMLTKAQLTDLILFNDWNNRINPYSDDVVLLNCVESDTDIDGDNNVAKAYKRVKAIEGTEQLIKYINTLTKVDDDMVFRATEYTMYKDGRYHWKDSQGFELVLQRNEKSTAKHYYDLF